jgi:hypothetical protein
LAEYIDCRLDAGIICLRQRLFEWCASDASVCYLSQVFTPDRSANCSSCALCVDQGWWPLLEFQHKDLKKLSKVLDSVPYDWTNKSSLTYIFFVVPCFSFFQALVTYGLYFVRSGGICLICLLHSSMLYKSFDFSLLSCLLLWPSTPRRRLYKNTLWSWRLPSTAFYTRLSPFLKLCRHPCRKSWALWRGVKWDLVRDAWSTYHRRSTGDDTFPILWSPDSLATPGFCRELNRRLRIAAPVLWALRA